MNYEYKKQKDLFIPKAQDILGSYARLKKVKEKTRHLISKEIPLPNKKQVVEEVMLEYN